MRKAVRWVGAMLVLSVVAGCDKCGNFNMNGPWNKVCADTKPRS
jgi:predicted small lipoprotein YifL